MVEQRQERNRQQQQLQKKGATSTRAVEQSEANFQAAVDTLASARAQLLEAQAGLLQSEATLAKARAELGAPGEDNPKLRAARAALRVELDPVPDGVALRVGTTASVLVMTGTDAASPAAGDPVAAPSALQ